MAAALTPRNAGYATALFFAGGLATFVFWAITGNVSPTLGYFRYGGAAFLVCAAAVETVVCLSIQRGFGPREPMGVVWMLLGMAGALRMAGYFSRHILFYHPDLVGLSITDAPVLDDFGRDLAGPVSMAVRAIALGLALRIHGTLGLRAGFKTGDWVLFGAVTAYGLWELAKLPGWIASAESPLSLQWYLGWSMYPLLSVLLAEAIALRRRIEPLRPGLFAMCWCSIVAGIVLTTLGVGLNELARRDVIRWPWEAGTWLVWYPASAAYLFAPLYQRMAMRRLEGWDLDESQSLDSDS